MDYGSYQGSAQIHAGMVITAWSGTWQTAPHLSITQMDQQLLEKGMIHVC